MTIQTFSPIKTTTTTYYLNEPTSFKSGELMFSDSDSTLYAMILRRDYADPTKYFILENLKLTGFNNGSSYDYRIDLSNWIKITHPDIKVTSSLTPNIWYIETPDNRCLIKLLIATTNPLTTNSSLITTLPNGQKYIPTVSINSTIANKLIANWVFQDNLQAGFTTERDIYAGGITSFTLGLFNNIVLDYIYYYDAAGSVISNYSLTNDITSSESVFKTLISKVPSNAVRLTISYRISGYENIINKNIIKGCIQNSYVYYGTKSQIATLNCSSKRERIDNILREEIKTGNNSKLLKIEKETTYQQNTGVYLSEETIFDISLAPFLTEIVTDTNQIKWLLTNESFEGFNLKKLGSRNFVLNLKKDNTQERFTSFENTFYS